MVGMPKGGKISLGIFFTARRAPHMTAMIATITDIGRRRMNENIELIYADISETNYEGRT
jgi:hypothetical protein